ncbi:hypothetical protein RA2_01731 [Roseovarius sp. A-2]|uniref:hypothetical protein n=1 Tax=Roseovarius sp. A-2 TaxID=1570360 RepID=UPI0009B55535|nr:hypothetical protein [Roseovarius sp. A-2]GAW34679.1 hypothetical protein RA2_01731 [Roseovarius sp. A-2]
MQHQPCRIGPVRYNPQQGAFEAVVDIMQGAVAIGYAVHFPAPLTAEYDRVMRGLRERAERLHRSGRAGLRMLRLTEHVIAAHSHAA